MIVYRNWIVLLHNIVNQIMNQNMQFIIDMLIFLLGEFVCHRFHFSKIIFRFLPGDKTAVRLTASHRCHDYINANEIRVIQII